MAVRHRRAGAQENSACTLPPSWLDLKKVYKDPLVPIVGSRAQKAVMAMEALSITLRTELRAGDVGMIIYLHGVIYAAERGFDATFEAYVAEPLAEFVRAGNPRERLWIAERAGRIVGCVAIVETSPVT